MSAKTVKICVTTFRRPQGLMRTLKSLSRLRLDDTDVNASVVVVDNDPSGSAKAVVDHFQSTAQMRVEYIHEGQRGISFARNRGLDAARDCDFLAFIDDDEQANSEWLRQLLLTQEEFCGDIVCGPVLSQFDAEPPEWIVRGGFFDRPQHRNGTRIRGDEARTGNVLISVAFIECHRLEFDPQFALTGGEDTHFFMRCEREGARIVWSERGEVTEVVPHSRANVAWLIRRRFRAGSTYTRGHLSIVRSRNSLVRYMTGGAFCVVRGITGFVASGMAKHRIVAAMALIANGFGMLFGCIGGRVFEYEDLHGN